MSEDRRVGKRGEQKRRADENLKHPCEADCGRLVWRDHRVCRPCYEANRRAATDARRAEIQRRWLAGESLRQISVALGTTPATIGVDVVNMRRAGWNVPRRGPGGKVLA